MISVIILGAGNVATHLFKAFNKAENIVVNQWFNRSLKSIDAYKKERIAALCDFLGTVIAGIYEGIKMGANEVPSDFETAAGRAHLPALAMVQQYYEKHS